MAKRFNTHPLYLSPDAHSAWFRYGWAVLAVAMASLLTLSIPAIGQRAVFMVYCVAIIQASYWLGTYPGLLALVLSLGLVNLLVLFPVWTAAPDDAAILNIVFILVSSKLIHTVSRHLQLAKKLWQIQQDLNHAQTVAQIGSWRLDIRQNQLRWSEENYRIFGIATGTPLTYDSFLAAVYHEDREQVDQKWRAAISGEPYEIEHRIMVKGKVKWVREKAELEFSPSGTLLGGFGTTQDITVLKQQELLLQESELKYAAIVKSALDAIITVDANQHIVVFNAAAEKMFACTTDEAIGQAIEHFIPARLHALDDQPIDNFGSTCGQSITEQAIVSGLRRNGEVFPVEVSISQTMINGKKSTTAILRDITERIRAEVALKEQLRLQDQLAKVAASVPGVICSFCLYPSGKTTMPYASTALESLYGLSHEQLVDDFSPVFDRTHVEDIPRIQASVAESARSLQPWHECFRYHHPTKGEIWIEGHSLPQQKADGSVLWHGFVQDITARKRTEAALRDREIELQLIMDAQPVLIAYLDTDFRYLRVNKTYETWFGMPLKTILGKSAWEIIGASAWTIVRPFLEKAKSGERISFDYQIPYGSSSPRWVQADYIPDQDENGKVKGIVVHVMDIDDRKHKEQQIAALNQKLQQRVEEMQVIFDTAPIGLAIAEDATGMEIRGNPATENMLGVVHGIELSKNRAPSAPYRSTLAGQDLAIQDLPMQRAVRGETVFNQIVEVIRPDQQLVTLLCNATPLLNAQGVPRGAVGAFQDISPLKRAEQTLRDSAERMLLATQATGVGIWEWHLSSNRVHWDAQMFCIYGIEPTVDGIVEYRTWSESVLAEDLPHQEHLLQAMFPNFRQYTTELRIQRANDRELRYIRAVVTARMNAQGQAEWIVGTNLDITEKVQAAQALQASEARLAIGIKVAGLALAEVDYSTGLNQLSAEAAQLFGLGDSAMLVSRETVHAAFHPEDRAEILRRINESLKPQGNGLFSMDHRVQLANGSVRWLRVHKQVWFGDINGEHRALRATLAIHDITTEMNAAETLRASEAFVRNLLNSLPESVVVLDEQGVVTAVNEPWQRFACANGGSPQAVSTGANYLEVCRKSSVAGDPYAHQALVGLEDLFAGRQQEFVMEYPCPAASQVLWFLLRAKRVFHNPDGIIMTHVDITDRKHAEEGLRDAQARLTLVVEEVKVGYWDWDLVGRSLYVSPEWKYQLGINEHETLNDLNAWQSRLHPDDQAFFLKVTDDYIAGNQPIYELDYRLRHQDGSYRWIHSRGVLLRKPNNQPYRLLGLNLDITDYKLSNELNIRRNSMEQTFRLYVASQTAAAIAHELNQPLTAISYYADVAQNMLETGNTNPPKLSEIMEKCSQQALRAGGVIRQLMTVLHRGEAISEPIDINLAVVEAVNFVKADEQLDNFIIKQKLSAHLPLVNANNLQVQKILINLLNNSLDSMREAGGDTGTIIISTRTAADNPSLVRVSVCDSGKGVANAAMLKTMFQPFHTTKAHGLGMGLAISRALIEVHNGKIWAEQNAGPGLTIHFTLPFVL